MAIKTIECVDCGAAVIYGRLSCSACGALLASVAGGRRSAIRILAPESESESAPRIEPESGALVEAAPEPEPDATHAVEPMPVAAPVAVQAHVRARPKTAPKRQRGAAMVASGIPPIATEPAAEPVWKFASLAARDAAVEPAVDAPIEPASVAPIESAIEPEPGPELVIELPDPEPAIERASEPAMEPTPESAVEHAFAAYGAPSVDEPAPWAPLEVSGPLLVARPYQRHGSREGDDPAEPTLAPGAYRPPTVAVAPAAAIPAPTSPARALTGTAAAEVTAPTARGLANAFPSPTSRIEGSAFVDIATWFVIVGATMSLLGFLLPWSVTVIGSSGVGGYFNSWGLASPTHLLVGIGLLVVLAFAVLNTRVPAWLGIGLLGLAFGGLLIGLVWPYVVGPLGADVGVTVTALGGLALVIGGTLASWATRHSESDPRV
jgi:hypothetical protein